MIELLVLRGGREVERYALATGTTTLGRAEDCDLLLDDAAVSRRHARLTVEGGRVFVSDLGSGNGTWIDGERVKDAELRDGTELRIEPFTLRVLVSATNAGIASTRPVEVTPAEPVAFQEPTPSAPRARTPGGSAALGPRLEPANPSSPPLLLGEGPRVLGRADEADFPLRDPGVSRRHARLSKEDGTFFVEDLGSTNGTLVNGRRVAERRALKDGDRVRLGSTELLFVDPTGSTLSAPSVAAVPTAPVPTKPLESTEAGAPPPEVLAAATSCSDDTNAPAAPLFELEAQAQARPAQRRIRSLAGAAMAMAVVVAVAIVLEAIPSSPGRPRAEPEPDREQRTMLASIERLTRDAEAALAGEPRDFARALQLYDRVARAAGAPELDAFARARELRAGAASMIHVLHEGLLAERLRRETEARAAADSDLRRTIEDGLAGARDGIAEGSAGRIAGYDRAAEALRRVLAADPSHPEASRLLEEALVARAALAGARDEAERRRLDERCARLHAQASTARRAGSAASLKRAVTLLDQVLAADAKGVTFWPDRARAEREAAIEALARIAAPLRESAARSLAAADPIAARAALRKAVALHPFDPALMEERRVAHEECLRSASHHLKLAKSFHEMGNDREALAEIERVQRFADLPEERLWRQAEELRRKIRRANGP